MARRGELQDVELLDEGDLVAYDHADPGAAPMRRGLRTALIAAALVVVVTLVGVQWVVSARERAAIAALATVPGVLAPVDEHLDVERRVPADDAAGLFGFGGWSLERAADGSQSFTWAPTADEGSGWTTQLTGPSPVLAQYDADDVVAGSYCTPDNAPGTAPSTAGTVVCLVSDGGYVLDPVNDSLVRVPATTTQVRVLSAADGTITATWPVHVGDAETVFAVLDDAVAIASTATTGTTLTLHDLLTGDARWSRSSPTRDGSTADTFSGLALSQVGTVLAYAPPDQPLTLIDADGTVVRELPGTIGDRFGFVTDQRGRVSLPSVVDGRQRTTLLAEDAEPAHDVTVDGALVDAVVDDGSVPDLLLTYDRELHAWDRSTGERRWSNETVISASGVVIMRGSVFVLAAGFVAAFDGVSGRTLWATTAEDEVTPSTISTDGSHLLATLEPTSTDGQPVLVAYDPAGGAEVFRVPYPAGVGDVSPINGRLVGIDTTTDGNDFVYVLLR
ncbi:PQQ-binding-like beta-propeller repeat protein [Cellulomonas humilata]|uniref:PQQ-binding-like beta-propeller repeat protein n=1 Tax=Cellulomonas humilata TaxID=144055 RepID=A0A7Y6DWR4_9CELL|nr:PQQ-binding-like beta-propeller repeat protein [Cellulomonas humilata]NUU16570.1 PQQ-binding-like beta-propeller repeat protein [Cellulomonas humilata]